MEGRTIAISTDQGRVLTNPAELNQLNKSTDAESLRATFCALCNRLPAPVRPIAQTSICSEVLGEMLTESDAYDQPDEEDSLLWAVLARRN